LFYWDQQVVSELIEKNKKKQSTHSRSICENIEAVSTPVVAAAKLLMLNPGEFELWKMRIEQYFLMTDYALWEVIAPTSAEQRLARKNELKARGTLLMALLNEHQLKFNSYKNAKSLIEAIEKRFGGNKETKKVQKTLLKQHYKNFNGSSSEELDQIHDRLQKLISQLEIHGTNEAVKTAHGVSTANSKDNVSTLPNVDSLSDAEIDLKWQMAMLTIRPRRFLKKTGRNLGINGTNTIGFDKTKCDGFGYDWSDQAEDGPTKFALMAYTSSGSSNSSGSDTESQLNVASYKAGLELVEARLVMYQKNEIVYEEDIKILKIDVMLRDKALTEHRKRFEKAKKERDDLKLRLEMFENSSKNLSKLLDSQVSDNHKSGLGYDSQVSDENKSDEHNISQMDDKNKTGKGYHEVPPPYTRNFLPPKPELVLADTNESVFSESAKKDCGALIIEDWESDSDKEDEPKYKVVKKTVVSKTIKPNYVKIEFVRPKSARKPVKQVRLDTNSSRGNQRNWNNMVSQRLGSDYEMINKACYECGSFNHLIKD
ncbi:hypothetical protein Tco_0367940, partial [Tanacetum coccineum]